MTTFEKYTHVERLGSVDTDGILQNPIIYVQPKVDGTNASVWFNQETDEIECGSRTRKLSAENDNAGFYAWVHSDAEEARQLRWFLECCPGYRVFGEWTGTTKFVGNIKDYNADALGHLYIFDLYDNEVDKYENVATAMAILETYDLDKWVIPIIATLSYPTMEEVQEIAEANKFLLDNANHAGEGVVLKVPNWVNKYGHFTYAKLVLDEYKQNKREAKKKVFENPEDYIVTNYATDAEISKAMAKVAVTCGDEEFDKTNGKHIGMLLNMVWTEAILEEAKNWTKKTKYATIDFAKLKKMCDTKTKDYAGIGK